MIDGDVATLTDLSSSQRLAIRMGVVWVDTYVFQSDSSANSSCAACYGGAFRREEVVRHGIACRMFGKWVENSRRDFLGGIRKVDYYHH